MANVTERKALADFCDRLAAMPEAEISWFAGWLSADGSIKPGGNGWAPSIRFVICDRDPLDRFAALFGNRVYGPFKMNEGAFGSRPRYEWKIAGAKAVALLERCLPWLSERYRERAERAMVYTVTNHGGRKIGPAEVAEIKRALATEGHGVGRKLAAQYGVSGGLISAIKKGRLWAEA